VTVSDPAAAPVDYRPYGWRGRLGLVVPTTNTVNEVEWARMAPEGVTVHSARTRLHAATDPLLLEDLGAAVDSLAPAAPDVIAYGCTAGSLTDDLGALTGFIERRCGIPAVATGPAIVHALQALGAERIALATPYHEALTLHERDFLTRHGIETLSMRCLGYGTNGPQEFARIAQVPPEAVYRFARAADHKAAQALVLSCTDLPTCPIVSALERELGKPVVTSNHATLWAALRRAGCNTPLDGNGRLLAIPG
jgi:maleate isomerase/arylmalonate decarboxylase